MDRRNLLKLLTIGGTGTAMGICGSSFSRAIASDSQVDWGYVGSKNPTYWGDLSSKYQTCKFGQMQSPINLQGAIKAELPTIQIAYQDIPLMILNNGHTIQVNTKPGNQITLNDKVFDLIQFHFHHPSEHQLMNKTYPMELHFVHRNQAGELAVLGVFLKAGTENAVLKPIWKAMPSKPQAEQVIAGVKIPIASLLPSQRDTYEYFGSLTTPPCSEIVNWVVFHDPIEISQFQIDQFKQIFSLNARPLQSLGHRFLLDVKS